MDEALVTTLRMHNPWLEEPGAQKALLRARLPGRYIPRTARLALEPGHAEMVVGPRQAGKSTWILESLSHIPDPVLILQAEEPRIRELCRSPAQALSELAPVLAGDTVILLEEVQHLDDAPLFIKGLVDLDRSRRIIVTGSSSFQLGGRTRESLAGRARRTRLLPLGLAEVSAELDAGLPEALRHERLLAMWDRLQVQGGYPEPWLSDEPHALLYHLVEAFVLRDASDLHTIERPSAFRKLLELASTDASNLVNLSSWASLARISRNTAARYIDIAEQAHVLHMLAPFAGGRRAEITSTPKAFFLDTGLRNALFAGFVPLANRPDRGALWECALFSEVLKHLGLLDEILFWRSKSGAEVDFVVRRDRRLLCLEAKAGAMRVPGIGRAARSFVDAYEPLCLGVINRSLRHDTRTGDTPVMFRRPWEIPELLALL